MLEILVKIRELSGKMSCWGKLAKKLSQELLSAGFLVLVT